MGKYEEIQKELDAIISESMNEFEDDETILTEKDAEELGYDKISKEVDKKIKDKCKGSGRGKLPLKTVIVAAILAAIIVGAVSVGAVKMIISHNVHKMKYRIEKDGIIITSDRETERVYDADEVQAYKDADQLLGVKVLKPTYLPEGFKLDKVEIYEDYIAVMLYRRGDAMLKFTQMTTDGGDGGTTVVDTKEANLYSIYAHGTEIVIIEYQREQIVETWYTATWVDDKLRYWVNAKCSKEEFERFIYGLK